MMTTRLRARPAPSARQRGLGLLSLLVFGVIAVGLVVLTMRILPSALEFFAAKRAIERIASSGDTSQAAIRNSFDRMSAVDDIASISGKDLGIVKTGQSVTISFAYEKKIPLVANASLLLDFEASAVTK
jgi:hypothetical protein